MSTVKELQEVVDAAFPQAAKVVKSDGSVYLTSYLTVVSPKSIAWVPCTSEDLPWSYIDADLNSVDWGGDSVVLNADVKLNKNFDLSADPQLAKYVSDNRAFTQKEWSPWLREMGTATGEAA